jgi:glycosyltransferase involved in cell wall biosynthesis
VRLVDLHVRGAGLPGLSHRKGLWVPFATLALAAWLRRERPDAILSTSNPANLVCLWARALAAANTPAVISVNVHLSTLAERGGPWGPLLRALVRISYRSADAIVAISQGVARDLAQALDLPPERIHVIHNPVPVAEIEAEARAPLEHPWLQPGEPPVVLAVAKLKRQKDLATLLRAFARLRARRPARLVILGEGEERSRLERLARELGVAADVALPGFAPNPWAWMARAGVLALSSRASATCWPRRWPAAARW